jgi:hypothetical protein
MISGDLKYDHRRNKAVSGAFEPETQEILLHVPRDSGEAERDREDAYEPTKRTAEGLPRAIGKAK